MDDAENIRNTRKAKINRNKNFPYKYSKTCIICGETYGLDVLNKGENNRCPICIVKRRIR